MLSVAFRVIEPGESESSRALAPIDRRHLSAIQDDEYEKPQAPIMGRAGIR